MAGVEHPLKVEVLWLVKVKVKVKVKAGED